MLKETLVHDHRYAFIIFKNNEISFRYREVSLVFLLRLLVNHCNREAEESLDLLRTSSA